MADFHERYTISIRDNALASDSFGFTSTYETQFRASVAEMLGQRCRMKFSNATIQPSHQSRTASSFHSVISSLPRRISRGTYIDEVSGPQSRLIRSIGSTGLKGTRLYGGSVGPCLHSAPRFCSAILRGSSALSFSFSGRKASRMTGCFCRMCTGSRPKNGQKFAMVIEVNARRERDKRRYLARR